MVAFYELSLHNDGNLFPNCKTVIPAARREDIQERFQTNPPSFSDSYLSDTCITLKQSYFFLHINQYKLNNVENVTPFILSLLYFLCIHSPRYLVVLILLTVPCMAEVIYWLWTTPIINTCARNKLPPVRHLCLVSEKRY